MATMAPGGVTDTEKVRLYLQAKLLHMTGMELEVETERTTDSAQKMVFKVRLPETLKDPNEIVRFKAILEQFNDEIGSVFSPVPAKDHTSAAVVPGTGGSFQISINEEPTIAEFLASSRDEAIYNEATKKLVR